MTDGKWKFHIYILFSAKPYFHWNQSNRTELNNCFDSCVFFFNLFFNCFMEEYTAIDGFLPLGNGNWFGYIFGLFWDYILLLFVHLFWQIEQIYLPENSSTEANLEKCSLKTTSWFFHNHSRNLIHTLSKR